MVKEQDKYKLKIKFIIFRKERVLNIDLDENKKIYLSKDDLINNICELKEKIKFLEDKLKQYNKEDNDNINTNETTQKDNLYNNFDIKLKENPIHELNYHTDYVRCLIMLKDGRMASASDDKSIIIYNKITFKPDLIIKEHNNYVYFITQLSSGILASCSKDKTIKLFNINGNNYNILQTLSFHTNEVYEIIELKNKQLVSCSYDKSVVFYFKDNNEYKLDYKIQTNNYCISVIQTKNNEICYSEFSQNNNNKNEYNICFFDILERKEKKTTNNIKGNHLLMIKDDLLLVIGYGLFIINVNQYNVIRVIENPVSSLIYSFCLLNENTLLIGDGSKAIKQWKIEGDNLKLISSKENTHQNSILSLLKLGNNLIASGSSDKTIRIW